MKSGTADQLMLSLGALLASEREKRGIPVERAAKDTRMRPQRIRDMENDDLSHFSNPSYARMFLIAYAKYLDIPMQTIREHLPDRGEPGTEGYQYINTSSEELPSLRRDISSNPRRSRWLVGIAVTSLAIVLLGVGFIVVFATVNAGRLTEALNRPPPPEPEKIVTVQVVENFEPKNVPTEQPKAQAFADPVDMTTAPSTPAPVSEMESTATIAEGPVVVTEEEEATKLPDPVTVLDDRAFLLGSTPEDDPAKTPAVR